MATKVNQKLLEFFTAQYKPGALGLVGTKDFIGKAIREAQKKLTPDHKPSLWSHCFILGDQRWDRRGAGGTTTKSVYLFESDIKLKLFKPQLRNGAQESWVGKWCSEDVENAAVIDFGLGGNQQNDLLATALQLVDEQVLYPIQELIGTWLAIVTGRQWQENPLDDPHAMYCSAFVRYCYQKAGKDFLGTEVTVSNTTPEHVAQGGTKLGTMTVYHG